MFDETLEVVMAKKEAVDKFLEQQAKLEEQKQAIIKDLLEERKLAMRGFDEQLAALGFEKLPAIARATSQRKCGICGESGHNARSCPKAPKKGKKE